MIFAVTVDNPVAFISTIIGLAALLGGSIVAFRGKRNSTTLETMKDAMDTLEAALRIERTERGVENKRCAEQIAHLQGQVDVLASGLADTIASKVMERLDTRRDGPRRV